MRDAYQWVRWNRPGSTLKHGEDVARYREPIRLPRETAQAYVADGSALELSAYDERVTADDVRRELRDWQPPPDEVATAPDLDDGTLWAIAERVQRMRWELSAPTNREGRRPFEKAAKAARALRKQVLEMGSDELEYLEALAGRNVVGDVLDLANRLDHAGAITTHVYDATKARHVAVGDCDDIVRTADPTPTWGERCVVGAVVSTLAGSLMSVKGAEDLLRAEDTTKLSQIDEDDWRRNLPGWSPDPAERRARSLRAAGERYQRFCEAHE